MDRWVEDRNVYDWAGDELVIKARGITHYRFPWQDWMVGEGLRRELAAAGVPPYVRVFYTPDAKGGGTVDVVIPGDDGGKLKSKVEKCVDKHKGTEAPAHKQLLEYAASLDDVANRLASGEPVSKEERDIFDGVKYLKGR